jgi:hypothetical protein
MVAVFVMVLHRVSEANSFIHLSIQLFNLFLYLFINYQYPLYAMHRSCHWDKK